MKRKRLHRTGLWEMGQPSHVTYVPLRLNTAPNSLSGWQLKCQFRQHQQTRCSCFCVNFTEWSVNRNTQTSSKCKFPLRIRINLKRPRKDEYYYYSVPAADVGQYVVIIEASLVHRFTYFLDQSSVYAPKCSGHAKAQFSKALLSSEYLGYRG